MSRGDIKFQDKPYMTVPAVRWQTEAAATAIYAGEPVKLKAAGSPYVIPVADGEPVIGTTTAVIGIAATDSTHTASADGFVMVYLPLPGIVYRARAKTTSTVDTQAEINALCGDRVVFDLTSSVYTVDAAAGDGATNGIYIVGGNPDTYEVYFTMRTSGTQLN